MRFRLSLAPSHIIVEQEILVAPVRYMNFDKLKKATSLDEAF